MGALLEIINVNVNQCKCFLEFIFVFKLKKEQVKLAIQSKVPMSVSLGLLLNDLKGIAGYSECAIVFNDALTPM